MPKNMKLLAIPLFELYDNAARWVRSLYIPTRTRSLSDSDTDHSSLLSRIFSLGTFRSRCAWRYLSHRQTHLRQVQLHLSVELLQKYSFVRLESHTVRNPSLHVVSH